MSRDVNLLMRYIGPSMAGMLICGTFSIVDSIFIGNAMGKAGLAAVAVTWPLVMLFGAVGDMLGTGAAIIISQSRGAGNIVQAQKAFGNMVSIQLLVAIGMMILLLLFLTPLLHLFGTAPELLSNAIAFARIMIFGSIPCMLTMGWLAVLRNDGQPALAMWITVLGLLLNIALDYLFIFPFRWGVQGAAAATVVSQTVMCCSGLVYFFTRYTQLNLNLKIMKLEMPLLKMIVKNGIPSLGSQITVIAMLFLHNFQAIRYGKVDGLAAYTFIAAIESMGSLLMTGLAAGVQPLVAFFYGAGKHKRKRRMGNYGYLAALLLGFIFMAVSIVGYRIFPSWFGLESGVAALAGHGLLLSSPAFIFLGVIRVAGYYYQSTEKISVASLLIYGDSFFALPLCLFVLPLWFGLDGVWLAMPISRLILFALLCWLWFGPRVYSSVKGASVCSTNR